MPQPNLQANKQAESNVKFTTSRLQDVEKFVTLQKSD